MKKSKIFWLVALLIVSAWAIRAQESPTRSGKRVHCSTTEKVERLSRALELTPEQRTEMQKLMDQKAERRAAQQVAAQAEREQFRKILTPEQCAKWEQMTKEKSGQMKPGAHRRGQGPRRGPLSGECHKGCCKSSEAQKGEVPQGCPGSGCRNR